MAFGAEQIDKFESLLDLEFEARGAKAGAAFQLAGVPLWRKAQLSEAARHAQEVLYAALDALTDEEKVAYGAYRARELAAAKARNS